MPVYIDVARERYGRMRMSHMLADTLEELHEMADKIGVARKWYQPKSTPHYDICQSKRKLALKLGAQVIGTQKLIELIRQYKRQD